MEINWSGECISEIFKITKVNVNNYPQMTVVYQHHF